MRFRKKSDKKKQTKPHGGKQRKRVTRAGATPKISVGLPSDPWWEEAFKLGVERSAAEAALNSLEEAKKEGIIGIKVYDRLREVYLVKLYAIDERAAKCYQKLPTLSEPAGRREMMQELSQAASQPVVAKGTAISRGLSGQVPGSGWGTTPRTAVPSSPAVPRKIAELPSGGLGTRRAMIDELKGVLSSASPFKAKAPKAKTVAENKVTIPEEEQGAAPATEKRIVQIAPEALSPRTPSPSASPLPSKLPGLNREFLAEFKKLRKPSS